MHIFLIIKSEHLEPVASLATQQHCPKKLPPGVITCKSSPVAFLLEVLSADRADGSAARAMQLMGYLEKKYGWTKSI